VKVDSGFSFVEARKIVQSMSAFRNGRSFAATASTRVQSISTQCFSIGTQTKFTWLNSQKEPMPLRTEKSAQTDKSSDTKTEKTQTSPQPETSNVSYTTPARPYQKSDIAPQVEKVVHLDQ